MLEIMAINSSTLIPSPLISLPYPSGRGMADRGSVYGRSRTETGCPSSRQCQQRLQGLPIRVKPTSEHGL